MPDVVKHAWTHRPRAQGGTDPIPVESGLPVAIAGLNGTSQATPGSVGVLTVPFLGLYTNDTDVFGYAEVSGTPSKAKYLTVKESGVYQVHAMMAWGSAISAAEEPFLSTRVWFPSITAEDTLINTFGNGFGSWMQEDVNPITTTQRNADETDYLALFSINTVNVDLADLGETDFGFGVGIGCTNAVTRFFDPYLMVTKLGDVMSEVTIT